MVHDYQRGTVTNLKSTTPFYDAVLECEFRNADSLHPLRQISRSLRKPESSCCQPVRNRRLMAVRHHPARAVSPKLTVVFVFDNMTARDSKS
jgi:hypothetical protein